MIAGLPMYDIEETREQTDTLWSAIASALKNEGFEGVPDRLDRETPERDLWTRPDLILGQTCGYPLMTSLRGRCTYVATPCYDAQGCDGPNYSSAIVVRDKDGPNTLADAKGLVAAVNGSESMSGHIALRAVFAPYAENGSFFSKAHITGSHLASLEAVSSGAADICASDCVSYAIAMRYRRELTKNLRILTHSPSAPGLPLITANTRAAEFESENRLQTLRRVLKHVYSAPQTRAAREDLFISGLAVLSVSDYVRVLEIEAGGAQLRILK